MEMKSKLVTKDRVFFYLESLALFLIFFLCLNLRKSIGSVYFYTFMSRDIDRALELIHGHLIFFGPEVSGGGTLPGALLYYLLAVALLISPVWQSCFWLLVFIYGWSVGILWSWLRRHFGPQMAFIAVILFAQSHACRSFILMFLNVSYMLPLALGAIVFAIVAFSAAESRYRDRALVLSCLFIGLGLHLHFSILCLLLAILFMHVFAETLGLFRARWRSLGMGLVVIGLTLLPYYLWRATQYFGLVWGQQPFFDGESPGAAAVLMMLAKNATQAPWNVNFREATLRFLAIVPYSLMASGGAIGLMRVVSWWKKQEYQPLALKEVEWRGLRALLWIIVWGFFPFSYVFLVHLGRRYGMVFCVGLVLLAVFLQGRLMIAKRSALYLLISQVGLTVLVFILYFVTRSPRAELFNLNQIYLLSAIVVFYLITKNKNSVVSIDLGNLILAAVLATVQFSMAAPREFREKMVPRYHQHDWVKVWTYIFSKTGWDYAETMQHVYFVNLRMNEDPKPIFADVQSKLGPRPEVENPPDGFFVLNAKFLNRQKRRDEWMKWLMNERIPQDIKSAITNKQIILDDPLFKSVMVVPYHIKNPQGFPKKMHDLGEDYQRDAREVLIDRVPENEGVLKTAENEWTFKWNECPAHDSFCSTGLILTAKAGELGKIRLYLTVLGGALSQNSPWVSPSFTEAWLKPELKLRCGGADFSFVLFESIGFRRFFGVNEYNEILQANNSVVAPFEREFVADCSGPIQELVFHREAAEIDHLLYTETLPARSLRWQAQAN